MTDAKPNATELLRYDSGCYMHDCPGHDISDDGDWCRYEDVDALLQRHAEALAAEQKTSEQLRALVCDFNTQCNERGAEIAERDARIAELERTATCSDHERDIYLVPFGNRLDGECVICENARRGNHEHQLCASLLERGNDIAGLHQEIAALQPLAELGRLAVTKELAWQTDQRNPIHCGGTFSRAEYAESRRQLNRALDAYIAAHPADAKKEE